MSAMSAVDPISSSPVALGGRRVGSSVGDSLPADTGPHGNGQSAQAPADNPDLPIPMPSAPATLGSSPFDAAMIAAQLPPPPPLPRARTELAWFNASSWLPPESDLRLKDVSI